MGAVDPERLQSFETLWDIANVGMDLWDIGSSLLQGDLAGAGAAGLGLLGDALATATPGIPGGLGTARRAAKAAEAAENALKLKRANQVRENFRKGKEAEEKCLSILRSEGRNVTLGSKGIKTMHGYRFPDIIERDANNVIVKLIEVKSGNARLSAAQKLKDDWIAATLGFPQSLYECLKFCTVRSKGTLRNGYSTSA